MKFGYLLSVGLGGALGAMARYSLSHYISERITILFPWGTLAANLIGCFIIGVLFEASDWITLSPAFRIMLTVGFIGALTTFSTFTMETLNLVRDAEWLLASLNVGGNLILGFLACVGATWLTRAVLTLIIA